MCLQLASKVGLIGKWRESRESYRWEFKGKRFKSKNMHVMLGRGYFLAVCLTRIWCHDGFLWLRWTSLSFITCLVVDSLPNQNFGFSIFFVVRVSASYLRIPSFTIITRLRGTAQSFILCAILIFSWSLSSILIISPIIWAHIFGYLWYPSKWPFCLLPFHL